MAMKSIMTFSRELSSHDLMERRTFGGTKVERPRRAMKLIVILEARYFNLL